MKRAFELSVQSHCFRAFRKNEEVIRRVQECGLSAIELCRDHADFTDEAMFSDVIDLYRRNGIRIVSLGIQLFQNRPAEERKFFEFAKRAGARTISADFGIETVPGSYRIAEKWADEYDVRIAIHNHGGRHWLGNAAALRHVFAHTSPRIGLCLDTAWALDAGEDPLPMVDEFGPRLYALHLKDFVFDRARKHQDTVLGTGNLDLKRLVAGLKKVDFCGPAIIEYEGDRENPVPALKDCIEAIRQAQAAMD